MDGELEPKRFLLVDGTMLSSGKRQFLVRGSYSRPAGSGRDPSVCSETQDTMPPTWSLFRTEAPHGEDTAEQPSERVLDLCYGVPTLC